MIEEGSFRRDLYYRINVINLDLPPLRNRTEDIPELASFFLSSCSVRMNKKIDGFTSEVFSRFFTYAWPGNIRELENVVERAVVLADGPLIGKDLLPADLSAVIPAEDGISSAGKMVRAREEAERECITAALEAHGWRRAETAQSLEMDKVTLYRKMKRLGIAADV